MKNLILLVLIVCVSVLVSGCASQESKTVEALEAAGVPDAQAFYDYVENGNGDFKLLYVDQAITIEPLGSVVERWKAIDADAWCVQLEPQDDKSIEKWIIVLRQDNKWIDWGVIYITALTPSQDQRIRASAQDLWRRIGCLS